MKTAIIIASFLLFACSSDKSESRNDNTNYYSTHTRDLEDTVRTLDLSYIAWACQCADWATQADIEEYHDQGDKLADKSVFIEPADSTQELSDTLGYSGDLIRFTGRFYKDKGYPKKYPKTDMQVDKAKVFQYTKYEVLKTNYRKFVEDTSTTKL